MRSQVRRLSPKYQSGLLPEFRNAQEDSGAAAVLPARWCASVCTFPQRRAVADLYCLEISFGLGSRRRLIALKKGLYFSAKSLKIGASGGAARAAEAKGCQLSLFTVSYVFVAPFEIRPPL